MSERNAERMVACNVLLPEGEAPPEWAELLPSGEVQGRDGRHWINDQPGAVVAAFAAQRVPLVLDWEHASEVRAPKGQDAPAAAWITELQDRAGAIWGRVEWTARAAAQITAREYRFLSPVFEYAKDTLRIMKLCSVALTNQPNLHLTALNRQMATPLSEDPMKKLLEALGLKPEATEDEAVLAVQALHGDLKTAKAANSQASPSLDKYVPRGDYDLALARATNAEHRIQEAEKAAQDTVIEGLIQEGLKGDPPKIDPATADYHRDQCRTEGGVERFRAFLKNAPGLLRESGLDGKQPGGQTKALNAEQRAVCTALGIPEAEFVKSLEVN